MLCFGYLGYVCLPYVKKLQKISLNGRTFWEFSRFFENFTGKYNVFLSCSSALSPSSRACSTLTLSPGSAAWVWTGVRPFPSARTTYQGLHTQTEMSLPLPVATGCQALLSWGWSLVCSSSISAVKLSTLSFVSTAAVCSRAQWPHRSRRHFSQQPPIFWVLQSFWPPLCSSPSMEVEWGERRAHLRPGNKWRTFDYTFPLRCGKGKKMEVDIPTFLPFLCLKEARGWEGDTGGRQKVLCCSFVLSLLSVFAWLSQKQGRLATLSLSPW